LAAVLLWLDIRWFLFYAFTLLLQGLHEIDRLRAIIRVLHLRDEAAIRTLCSSAGVTDAQIEARWHEEYDGLTPEQQESVDYDARRAISGKLV